MKYLVTGGAGFIGSHIVERLLKEGNSVVVLDNFSSGKESNLSFVSNYTLAATRYTLISGDIRDKETCEKATVGVDAILHQAALRSVPKSLKEPHAYNDVNIDGTLKILEAAVKNKVKRVVIASSSSVYGDVDVFPQTEEFLPKLISPYALSKLTTEYYCRIFSEHFGLETVALRYFNVFGPRQALDDEYAVVIPKFIHCIMHDEQPPIFGTGLQSRDFTYIDNVVEANIRAATAAPANSANPDPKLNATRYPLDANLDAKPYPLNAKVFHAVLNVANGKDTTVLELVAMLNQILGKNIKPKLLPVRAGDVFRTLADISKIKSVLGFKPLVNFEEGLSRTVDYFRKAYSV